MLTNYFKIAIRNLMKNKLFSFINISGMAIGLASCLLIGLFVWDEVLFDRFHPDGNRTYRVYNIANQSDGTSRYLPIVPYPFASYMQKDFPEIESTLRMMDMYGELLFEAKDKKMMEPNGLFAEPSVFDMLTLNVVSGNASDALTKPGTIALSSSLAKKYFGDRNPIGETIKVNNEVNEITAVFSDPPRHLHMKINYLISFSSTGWQTRFETNWQRQQLFTYLKLKPGTDAKALEDKFKPFVEKYAYPTIQPQGITYVPYLQNIKDIHLNSSHFEWDVAQHGNAQTVYVLAGTGILILIIAALNFINLSTARAVKRIKEVGVRKVVGAHRRQLVQQFIVESLCITFAGLLLALLAVEIALPGLNAFSGKELALPFTPFLTGSIFLFCCLLGFVAGSYPAFYLSGFKPATALYNKEGSAKGTALFRQGLVVLQFMFSFFLITSAMIVVSQRDLLLNKDLGFDKEQLVMIPLRHAQLKNQESTKREFSNHPNVVSSTIGFGVPGDIAAGDGVIDPATKTNLPTTLYCVDYDYIKTMGMHIIAGRDFSRDFPSDETKGFILNETALKVFGFGSPEKAIGHGLDWKQWDNNDSLKRGVVIGVVQDFHFKSLREKLTPVVMQIYPSASWKIVLRIKPDNMPATLAHLKSTYERLDPEWAFTYKFADENFDEMYRSEERLSVLFTIFTGLAIAVACLGLFGLVEYSVHQRTKEISIRKVFGASIKSLLVLLTRNYFGLVLTAFVVIIPVSYYAAQQWLTNFAYHITVSPWMYGKACGLILLITIVTVSFQSLKAAWTNPVESLRTE